VKIRGLVLETQLGAAAVDKNAIDA